MTNVICFFGFVSIVIITFQLPQSDKVQTHFMGGQLNGPKLSRG